MFSCHGYRYLQKYHEKVMSLLGVGEQLLNVFSYVMLLRVITFPMLLLGHATMHLYNHWDNTVFKLIYFVHNVLRGDLRESANV